MVRSKAPLLLVSLALVAVLLVAYFRSASDPASDLKRQSFIQPRLPPHECRNTTLPRLPASHPPRASPSLVQGRLTSPLSPGLAQCTANPFLLGYSTERLMLYEQHYINWRQTQYASLYHTLLDYYFDPQWDPEAVPHRPSLLHKLLDELRLGKSGHRHEGIFIYRNPNAARYGQVLMPPSELFLCCPHPGGTRRYGDSAVAFGKYLCGMDVYPELRKRSSSGDNNGTAPTPTACNIVSLGSSNMFNFEEALSRETPCNVHVFDCTSAGPSTSLPRVYFHQQCVGLPAPPGQPNRNLQEKLFPYRSPPPGWHSHTELSSLRGAVLHSYASIVEDLKRQHGPEATVDVLKVDVEGAEYAVFLDLLSSGGKDMPFQLSFESHWWERDVGHALLTHQLFSDLWRHGYRILMREDQRDKTCFEWTLLRVFC